MDINVALRDTLAFLRERGCVPPECAMSAARGTLCAAPLGSEHLALTVSSGRLLWERLSSSVVSDVAAGIDADAAGAAPFSSASRAVSDAVGVGVQQQSFESAREHGPSHRRSRRVDSMAAVILSPALPNGAASLESERPDRASPMNLVGASAQPLPLLPPQLPEFRDASEWNKRPSVMHLGDDVGLLQKQWRTGCAAALGTASVDAEDATTTLTTTACGSNLAAPAMKCSGSTDSRMAVPPEPLAAANTAPAAPSASVLGDADGDIVGALSTAARALPRGMLSALGRAEAAAIEADLALFGADADLLCASQPDRFLAAAHTLRPTRQLQPPTIRSHATNPAPASLPRVSNWWRAWPKFLISRLCATNCSRRP